MAEIIGDSELIRALRNVVRTSRYHEILDLPPEMVAAYEDHLESAVDHVRQEHHAGHTTTSQTRVVFPNAQNKELWQVDLDFDKWTLVFRANPQLDVTWIAFVRIGYDVNPDGQIVVYGAENIGISNPGTGEPS